MTPNPQELLKFWSELLQPACAVCVLYLILQAIVRLVCYSLLLFEKSESGIRNLCIFQQCQHFLPVAEQKVSASALKVLSSQTVWELCCLQGGHVKGWLNEACSTRCFTLLNMFWWLYGRCWNAVYITITEQRLALLDSAGLGNR